MDLSVEFLLPECLEICSGEYSVQRHIHVSQPDAGDFLAVLTPLLPGRDAPRTSYDAASGLLDVIHGNQHDRVFLSPMPQHVALGEKSFSGRVAVEREGVWQPLDGFFSDVL
jgi:hypothetical protein